MKHLHRFVILILLLCLTACGTIIRLEGVEIEFPERDSTPTREVITPTAQPTNTATPTPSPTTAAGLQAFTTANVNLRSVPTTINNTPIDLLVAGTEVRLLGRLDNNNPTWVKVERGWIYSQNLRIVGTLSSLPIVPAPPTNGKAGSRIGYNINGESVPNMTYLQGELISPCKSLNLVMNNLSLAVWIKEQCPDSNVVSRSYSALEGDEWFYRSPQNFVDQCNREGHKDIIRHSTNEPSFGHGQRLIEFVNKEIELMQKARAAGCTFAMGNFSVGIFEASDINAGYFDNYIRALNQYGHYLAVHEYACCALPFGVGQWQVDFLLDRNRVQPASWPMAAALPISYWDGQLPPYWYLLRASWFLLRADTIGVPRPRILVTEFGWDNLPNIKPQIEDLRQRFGLPQYFLDMRGVNTYPRLWNHYWPQWDFDQAVCEQLAWAESIYPPEYLGFALFTWTNNRAHWGQTDFSGAENGAHFEVHKCF